MKTINLWKTQLKQTSWLLQLIGSVSAVVLIIVLSESYFVYIENMPCRVYINDWILGLVPPIDFSNFIFILTYLGSLAGFLILIQYPKRLLHLLQAYVLMQSIRFLLMYLIPLDTPPDHLYLQDFVLSNLYQNIPITRDLFFSGHTGTVILFALFCPYRKIKIVLFICSIVVGFLLVWQHVHYTIDIIGAFVFLPFIKYLVQAAHGSTD